MDQKQEKMRLFRRAEALLKNEVAEGIKKNTAEFNCTDRFAQILTRAIQAFWNNYDLLSKKPVSRLNINQEEEFTYLNKLSYLASQLKDANKKIIQCREDESDLVWALGNLAYQVHNANSDILQRIPFPTLRPALENLLAHLCQELGIDSGPLLHEAIACDSYNTIEDKSAKRSKDFERSITHLKMSPEMALIAKSSAMAYWQEVSALRSRNHPAFLPKLKEASPAYYEAYILNKPHDEIRDSGADIHAMGRGFSYFEAAISEYRRGDREKFDNRINQYFSKKNEREMIDDIGAFLRPLRHALSMFCNYVNIIPEDIVRNSQSRAIPYAERISKAASVALEDLTKDEGPIRS